MRDPIELYEYPKEWIRKGAEKRISSGLYILTPRGWLRRGITTGTTASAAVVASISSLKQNVRRVAVSTPAGIRVEVAVSAENGVARARKFSGDHAFDATDGVVFVARTIGEEGIRFGRGIARGDDFVVSQAARQQLMENYRRACQDFGYDGGVMIEAEFTRKSERLNGIAILGTTGFVEPWCEELLKTKIEIARRYERIAVTTGRESWKAARELFPGFQPFVFGVHLKEILNAHGGEIVVVGKRGLLKHVFGSENPEDVLKLAREFGNVLEVVVC
ncbi:MAG: cobalt-precorrin-5B (C(1))-methyltransferase [Candidatus Methanoglobus sp.]